LEAKRGYSPDQLKGWVESGRGREALEALLFFTSPQEFPEALNGLLGELGSGFSGAAPGVQKSSLQFLVDLALAIRSFLPMWNLADASQHGQAALSDSQIREELDTTLGVLDRCESTASQVSREVAAERREEAEARFREEGAAGNAGALSDELVGHSLREHVEHMGDAFDESNLARLSRMRAAGETITELGNDYAAFLLHCMYLGGSFVTTNPPLVDIAWTADPDRWTPIVDDIIAANPNADESSLARLVTMEVVLSNMRLLRPIFLLTEGKKGYVSLQVNPKKHGDSPAMVADALAIYDELSARLDGGVPNVVFKLPGTLAGLAACRELTGRGIGVNITVNFGMFQQVRFAQTIADGEALASYLTEMNGRLAYPVRDEMVSKAESGELKEHGIDVDRAREAAAWSGVAVVKRLHGLLSQKGYDLGRVRPLVASLRVYKGQGYTDLPSSFPDITEDAGVSVITVFPNVRRPFDEEGELTLEGDRVEAPVPEDILTALTHSEIFKQAYYVDDEDWITDDGKFRPDKVLSLEDEESTIAWEPVNATMTQFGEAYDRFVQRILGRKAILTIRGNLEEGRSPSQEPEALRLALANFDRRTVVETLRLIAECPEEERLASILEGEGVLANINEVGEGYDLEAALQLARGKHGGNSLLRRLVEAFSSEEPIEAKGVFASSRLDRDGDSYWTCRLAGLDYLLVMFTPGGFSRRELLRGEEAMFRAGDSDVGVRVCPATLDNLLTLDREIAPEPRLQALNAAGFRGGLGTGNRVIVAEGDGRALDDSMSLGVFEGIFEAVVEDDVPNWFVQQSIVRELIPDGVDPKLHPALGHTGGYGPRELLRTGLFAYMSLGGYICGRLPFGADADHAIVMGHDEAELSDSMALNKAALMESVNYTKFTVDTSQLFGFPTMLSEDDRRRVLATFEDRKFVVANVRPEMEGFIFSYGSEEALSLAEKYWRACQVHRELYGFVADLKNGESFDYELSLDETPEATDPKELLFYLVLLEETMGLPRGSVASAAPSFGFKKRTDFEGSVEAELKPQANACASVLGHFGMVPCIHSGSGLGVETGKGPGVDEALSWATCGKLQLKVSGIYQEILWRTLADSQDKKERALFERAWDAARNAVETLANAYDGLIAGKDSNQVRQSLADQVRLQREAEAAGIDSDGVKLIRKVLAYGPGQARLAKELMASADPADKRATDDFFRHFAYLVFRDMRGDIYAAMRPDTWDEYERRVKDYTRMRVRDLGLAGTK
jgi:hypothetical protein